MENIYNPGLLPLRAATYFESEGKMRCTVTNKEVAQYIIDINIKDSTEKFRIATVGKNVEVLKGKRIQTPDALEKNKDILGAVTVFKKNEVKRRFANYKEFANWYLEGR